jgi:glycosyltransferase involved in cell wall biosynthesis
VLTPVRNEAWILPRFLAVTQRVADLIIVLDQNSTDGSAEICQAHPKVRLLRNPNSKYDEAERQRILIETARKLVPMPRVLLALDADEVLAADAPSTPDWHRGLSAAPGTILMIEKPTFYGGIDRVIRYPGGFPLGFVDDDSPHEARLIHSVRIPMPAGAVRLALNQVKVLHYALLRSTAQAAKARMYGAIENLAGARHLLARRHLYGSQKDYSREGPIEPTPARWLQGWEQAGIDMRTVSDDPPHWQDLEVLRLFAEHGTRRFWLDDIWDPDWESYRQEALRRGIDRLPRRPIQPPPAMLRWMMKAPDLAYKALRALRSGGAPRFAGSAVKRPGFDNPCQRLICPQR